MFRRLREAYRAARRQLERDREIAVLRAIQTLGPVTRSYEVWTYLQNQEKAGRTGFRAELWADITWGILDVFKTLERLEKAELVYGWRAYNPKRIYADYMLRLLPAGERVLELLDKGADELQAGRPSP